MAKQRKPEPLKAVLDDLTGVAARLETQVEVVESDRVRAALLRVLSAVYAVKDAVDTDGYMERK